MKNNLRNSYLIASLLGVGLCHQASAVFVYNNGTNDLATRFDPGVSEVGDEIVLAGTERLMTRFDFEYWGTRGGADVGVFAGLVTARLRFYANTGPLISGEASPAAVPFYDSGVFAVPSPTPRATFIFVPGADGIPAGGLLLPDSFTWSVQFTTANANDRVGLDLYSPPEVGSNFTDYWLRDFNTGVWSLQADPNGVVPFDFGARIQAQAVPETTGIGIFFMSFLGLLAFAGMTRRFQSV